MHLLVNSVLKRYGPKLQQSHEGLHIEVFCEHEAKIILGDRVMKEFLPEDDKFLIALKFLCTKYKTEKYKERWAKDFPDHICSYIHRYQLAFNRRHIHKYFYESDEESF